MNVLEGLLEVLLVEEDDFLKIKETLTRIGVASKREQKLFQSCHILHKRGKYYIVHFKEMFMLDGKHATFTEEDAARRTAISWLLDEWKLLSICDKTKFPKPEFMPHKLKILPHSQKHDWVLESKYSIGRQF